MSDTSNYLAALNDILLHPTGGVVGLVDELLKICRDYRLELDWQADRYRVRSGSGAWEDVSARPARTSVFRDALARLAVLCNERTPNSVSFYGGHGELSAALNPEAVFSVDFVNTHTEQRLYLMPIQLSAAIETDGKTNGVQSGPSRPRNVKAENKCRST
jgi:hypothetical protein